MTPSQRRAVGAVLLVVLLLGLGTIFVATMRRYEGTSRGFDNSVVVEERMKRVGK